MLERVHLRRLGRATLRFVADPSRLGRKLREHEARRRFRTRVVRSAPINIPPGGDAEVHILAGDRSLLDAIASLKSLYRFLDDPLPLVLHDDGTIREKHWRFLDWHFPG